MRTASLLTGFASLLSISRCSPAASITNQHILSGAQQPNADGVRDALKEASIIPSILDDFTPSYLLSISYPESRVSIGLGNDVAPPDVSRAPVFVIQPSDSSLAGITPSRTIASNKTYTLVLTDPDATSRAHPVKSKMCHWIVTGLNISDTGVSVVPLSASPVRPEPDGFQSFTDANEDMSLSLDELMSYYAPAPPPKTGKHRYIFVLLEPEANGNRKLRTPKKRPHWGFKKQGKEVREWAGQNNLVAVGANFFYSENEKQ